MKFKLKKAAPKPRKVNVAFYIETILKDALDKKSAELGVGNSVLVGYILRKAFKADLKHKNQRRNNNAESVVSE